MSDERLTTSSFQSLSVIHIIKSKSCLEEICPCQSYGSSRPLRSGCSSSTSGLSSFSRRVRGRLRGSGARRNEGGRDVVLTDADFPSNERPCGRSSACTHSCVRLKRKRRNRRPIRHVKGLAGPEAKAASERARWLIEQAEALGEPSEDPLPLFLALYGSLQAVFTAFDGDLA